MATFLRFVVEVGHLLPILPARSVPAHSAKDQGEFLVVPGISYTMEAFTLE
jgi:hypothetical protein